MRDGMVEIQESYFKRPDGSIFVRRKIGSITLWEGNAPPMFFVEVDLPWNLLRKPATSLVKEAPKAMVLYASNAH